VCDFDFDTLKISADYKKKELKHNYRYFVFADSQDKSILLDTSVLVLEAHEQIISHKINQAKVYWKH
jgi:DNA-binding transcriptional regulator WhiA